MSEEPPSITKLFDQLEDLKRQINIVENALEYKNDQEDYEFRRKLLAKTETIELVKTSLEKLSLKVKNVPIRESKGRAAGPVSDSGYNSECPERRNAVYLDGVDLQDPVELDDSLENPGPGPGQQCSMCRQHIKTPVQVTEETESSGRKSTEHEDASEI